LYCIGNNSFGQCGVVTEQNIFIPRVVQTLYKIDIIKIACGASHTLALSAKGNVWAFGNNEYGQLGTGDTKDTMIPKAIKDITNIVDFACGGTHSALVNANGHVYAFGKGKNGQLVRKREKRV
jgi:alpha-tubulin suppressor-like RCC1 family protein